MTRFENPDNTANAYTQINIRAGSANSYFWTANQNSTSWGGANSLNIYTDAGNMTFWTSAAEKARILTNGNMGIGTVAPSQKLEVAGTIYSTSGGYKFPDGTVQTTAASGGGGITAVTSVSCSQTSYCNGSCSVSCTSTCAAGWFRTGCGNGNPTGTNACLSTPVGASNGNATAN